MALYNADKGAMNVIIYICATTGQVTSPRSKGTRSYSLLHPKNQAQDLAFGSPILNV